MKDKIRSVSTGLILSFKIKTMQAKQIQFLLPLIIILCTVFNAYSQTGTVRGQIIDSETGEELIAVSVFEKEFSRGTSTDFEGRFSLDLPVGTHEIEVSYISYQTQIIQDIEVKENEVTVLPEILLQESGLVLEEAVVTAKANRSSEAAVMLLKKNSTTLLDGISSSNIKLVGDATAIEAAKRVTGVSIEDGKYIYVRGLGDRYTKVQLHNVDIPGLDPDKNSLQMDIFPSALIDQITVSKTFSADMAADFTGGLVNIETKDFPETKIFDVSIGGSYNPDMHFNSEFLAYNGGSTDFLGFDDGTRSLPPAARRNSIPTPVSGATPEQVTNFVNSFEPQLGAQNMMSGMDYSASVTLGNQFNVGKSKDGNSPTNKLGYIFSTSYRTDYTYYDDVFYGEYQKFTDPEVTGLRYATTQKGQLGEKEVLIGLLGGLAYKTQKSRYRLKALHLQSGLSRAGQFDVDNDGQAIGQSGYIAYSDNLEYNQRGMTNFLLNGTHTLPGSGWEIDWRVSPTFSNSEDPDIRRTAFTVESTFTAFVAGAGGNPSRIWRNLDEVNNVSKLDFTKKLTLAGEDSKILFGGMHTYKERDYEILFYDMQFFGDQNWGENPTTSEVLRPENIYPGETNNIYYQSGNASPNPNAYNSNVNNYGGYTSFEFKPWSKLKTVLGLRGEYYVQRHTGRDQAFASGDIENGNNLDNEIVLESFDLFPTANFIYSVSDKQNIRLSGTKTIARPSFKELSFAQILDPLTNRIFNGSLFNYSDWAGQMIETRIQNYDLRWEYFMPKNQIFSISAFYKSFQDPIELVRIPEQQTSTEFQPRNVGDGRILGLEIEARKYLDFIGYALKDFSVNVNVTVIQSQIDMSDAEFRARKNFEKVGENIEPTREMAGQSPYVINAGLTYGNFDRGINTGFFYNVKGETLEIVGGGLFPDIYFQPFHSLNFSFAKTIGAEKRTSIDFRVGNILNERLESYYVGFEASPEIFNSVNPGRSFSLGISHKF